MKSFLWRMRSNVIYFLAAMVVFTVVYIIRAYNEIHFSRDSDIVSCLGGIDPVIVSGCVCFGFFFICQKRYNFDEAYAYGQSRKCAFLSSLCSAIVYSLLFACYALGVAMLVRRAILSMPKLVVSEKIYNITAWEIFCNFAFLFIIDMIAYEAANILRKFRSWRFWLTLAVCAATAVLLYIFIVYLPQHKGSSILPINYWKAMFSAFTPQLFIMIGGDFLLTRRRQYR